ncbi:MBL fold metallo-hydrolase [Natrarchaeobaculum aegyptiacum]|uniref:MBL fold metallo-hydrolase n=1 Tax=Natrarchaeobaculum aegyptiacum TaxID=745377 RepID=A0A2Z2HTS2_9EURY|nr:MBL fold metallo-hydrolase [Natrarchaeobaculum aegyptiacum]ARS88817.1 MBL fold metallo-hydrolase [Natrarchaeobaculum aegyptiacum]
MSETERANVHALPISIEYGGRPLTITPVVLETDRGLVLVDVGPEGAIDAIASHVEDLGYDLQDVWLVLCTHHDGDHVAGLAELLERTDAIVAAHEAEAPYVRGDEEPIKGDGDRYSPVRVDLELADGVRIPTLDGPVELVETPGHSPGHVSLYKPSSSLLIAGDALVADGDEPLSGPKPEYTPDEERALESVGRLADLEIDQVVCYHGGHVEAGSDRIREIAATRD